MLLNTKKRLTRWKCGFRAEQSLDSSDLEVKNRGSFEFSGAVECRRGALRIFKISACVLQREEWY